MMRITLFFAVAAMVVALCAAAAVPGSAQAMLQSARSFLGSLGAEQKAQASLPFASDNRRDWHFVPRSRKGIPLGELNAAQRKAADDLLKSGLGPRGYTKARAVFELEGVLREIEGPYRDPGLYFLSVFGTPSPTDPWGFRVEGHHLSLNYTVVGEQGVATSPAFFGANPAAHGGKRPLAEEEDLARALLLSLDPTQRRQAVFDAVAPREIVTGSRAKVAPLDAAGLPASQLNPAQRKQLEALLDVYLARMPADLAAERWKKLRHAGLDQVRFAWAGGAERGQPHYYRLQGATFLVEYDNTQDGANHIHTVWRDFDGDFGEDLLRRHYRDAPHPK